MNINLAEVIQARSQEEVNAHSPGDYVGKDGLLHCGVCGQPKQFRYHPAGGGEMIFACVCECVMKTRREKEARRAFRDDMEQIKKLRGASMMAGAFLDARFEGYTVTRTNERAHRIALRYVDRFAELEKKNRGLIFYGTVGTGKSFTAACIANRLLDNRVSVVMTSFVKALQDMQSGAVREGEYISLLNRARLLVIDDLGAERSTDYALEKVYNIIDSRVRAAKPMILTTNLTMDEMMSQADIRYRRIYDRIFGCCYPVEMVGPSLRMEKAADNFEQMGAMLE